MLDRFKEYNDPKIYRGLKIGFASLIVLAALLFSIGLAVSPDLRHDIGIGGATPVERPIHTHPRGASHEVVKHPKPSAKKNDEGHNERQGKTRQHGNGDNGSHVHHGHGGEQGESQPTPVPTKPPTEHHSGHPGSGSPQPESPSPSPGSPPSTHPSEPKGGEEEHGGHEESKPPVKVEIEPPKVEVEVHIPPVTEAPLVEEVTHTVNETVNGVTGTVEETVNGVGKGLGVHVEVPEICVINCPNP